MTTSTVIHPCTASCPHCGGEVQLVGRLMIGEVFACGSCGIQLEVAGTVPLILETLAKVDDDEEDFVL